MEAIPCSGSIDHNSKPQNLKFPKTLKHNLTYLVVVMQFFPQCNSPLGIDAHSGDTVDVKRLADAVGVAAVIDEAGEPTRHSRVRHAVLVNPAAPRSSNRRVVSQQQPSLFCRRPARQCTHSICAGAIQQGPTSTRTCVRVRVCVACCP